MEPTGKPLFIYDGSCGFCRAWVERLKARTFDRIAFAPFQEASTNYSQISTDQFAEAAHFVDEHGEISNGAEAVYRALTYAPWRSGLYWAYKKVPGFAPISRVGYRFVANHRGFVSLMTKLFWGNSLGGPTHHLARWLFLKLLAVVYLIAFVSAGVQILGLIGQDGITPASDWLRLVEDRIGDDRYWRVPTLCWFNASDLFLQGLCYGGAGLSILLILGITPLPILILLWVMYLSICNVGGVFFNFQWDSLLTEVGFLGIFFAPMGLWPRMDKVAPPSKIVLMLIRWLLFRLMFLSGYVKLASGDVTWNNLTALTLHYETQPLPTWTSYYAHQLPLWFQKFCCGVMFIIELAIPFFIFGPRRLRQIAFFSFVVFMMLIAATGNYNFFNLLTVVLCFALLDDGFLKRFFPAKKIDWLNQTQPYKASGYMRGSICALLAVVIVFASVLQGLRRSPYWKNIPPAARQTMAYTAPFRSVNNYGLFANMTETRPELIIEGSHNGTTWEEYGFHYKPGNVQRQPGFVQPHQPRLDWQLWFAALGNYRNPRNQFVFNMMNRILIDEPEVMKFIAHNPFPDEPPMYIRAVKYRYTFTDLETKRKTGAWWNRELLGTYGPMLTKPRTK